MAIRPVTVCKWKIEFEEVLNMAGSRDHAGMESTCDESAKSDRPACFFGKVHAIKGGSVISLFLCHAFMYIEANQTQPA
jgi:hypothetical protein